MTKKIIVEGRTCDWCGSINIIDADPDDGGEKYVCGDCGTFYYENND